MQMTDTVKSILRRWYVFITGVLLSLALGWTAYQAVPPDYEASGSVILMPSEVTVGDTGNPFLYLGGMTNAVDVLIRRANATEVREELLSRHDGAEYTITRDLTTDSPIAVVSVTAPTARLATELRNTALTTIEMNLDSMQNELDIEPGLRIYLRDVVVGQEATVNNKSAIQLALVVIAVGLVGTFMLTGIADGILTRRRNRKTAHHQAEADERAPQEKSPVGRAIVDVDNNDPTARDPYLDSELSAETSRLSSDHFAESRP